MNLVIIPNASLILILISFLIVNSVQLKISLNNREDSDSESEYEKFNSIIASPPPVGEINPSSLSNYPELISNSDMGNEEYVLVPTPVDPSTFEQLKKDKNNKVIDFNLPSALNKAQEPNVLKGIVGNVQTNKNEQSLLDDNDPEKIKKFINAQENDYQKYFDQINKIEFQKVYQSLNQNQMGTLSKQMNAADSMLDYNNINLQNSKLNMNNDMVELPVNKKENAENYSKIFTEIYKNNTESLSFIQKNTNKDIKLTDGKTPMYGTVDSKINKFTPKVIGFAEKNQVNSKDYLKQEDHSEAEKKEKLNLEMEKRTKDNYPRFRGIFSFEKSDQEEKEYKKTLKQKEYIKMKKKIEREGTSFIQEYMTNPDNRHKLIKAVDHLVSQRNKSSKGEVRINLANCKRNCDSACKRFSKLKNETEDFCRMKCQLACSNNAINNLLQ